MMRKIKAILLMLCIILMTAGNVSVAEAAGKTAAKENPPEEGFDYDVRLFDTDIVHTIDVKISEKDWQDLLEHPTDKTKYETDLVIDGETVEKVTFSTKGNSSLFLVASDTDACRYSFKVNFGGVTKGQTWHGLDKLNLQNQFADATCMKEYICFDLFRKMGVPAPLTSFVWLTVNGEDFGLYLAIEGVEESFLERRLQGEGTLYKPENKKLGLDEDAAKKLIEGESAVISSGTNGADLVYTDDLEEHYTDIFDEAETKDDPETREHVIRALKALSEQKDLEEYLDIETTIRYFAVHNFFSNYDGYTGPMLHNYYLYERDGKLAVLPWDYNLCFGAFPMDGQLAHESDSSVVVNYGIDSPLVGAGEQERPMWSWIMSDEKYRTQYHEVLEELITEYFDTGKFVKETASVYKKIFPYVKKDPTAFFTLKEYTIAYKTLREVLNLRAESIRRQLDGRLSTVTEQQQEQDRVDASGIRIRDMGSALITSRNSAR